MTDINSLVGLSELAELLDLTKNQANAMRQRPGFPTPKVKFAMGPAWDKNEVLSYVGKEGALEIKLLDGAMFARVRNSGCFQCDSMDITILPGAELVIDSEKTVVEFTYHCNTCMIDVDRYVDLKKEVL